MSLRKFTKENNIKRCFTYWTSPLIKIGETLDYYNTEKDKLNALRNRTKDDKFIIAWKGEWRTDVFEVTEKDIKEVLSKV